MLQLLGYNKPSPQPSKPAIKMQGDVSKTRLGFSWGNLVLWQNDEAKASSKFCSLTVVSVGKLGFKGFLCLYMHVWIKGSLLIFCCPRIEWLWSLSFHTSVCLYLYLETFIMPVVFHLYRVCVHICYAFSRGQVHWDDIRVCHLVSLTLWPQMTRCFIKTCLLVFRPVLGKRKSHFLIILKNRVSTLITFSAVMVSCVAAREVKGLAS